MLRCIEEDIIKASRYVREGSLVVYPTDTVYGIGCDPYNDEAIEKIFTIKRRERGKPLPLLCSSLEFAANIASLDERALTLARHFWPGALTIITQLKDLRISSKITAERDKIGVRVPDHNCALSLIKRCNNVLVGTSANISGRGSVNNVDELDPLIKSSCIVLDGGRTSGIESTVIDMIELRLIREGRISKREIERVLGIEIH